MNRSLTNTDSSVFLDANVLLEIVLGRQHEQLVREFLRTEKGELCISALTAHLVVHFGSERTELPVLRQFLSDYAMETLEPADFEWAFTNARNHDFEDALQLAAGIRHGSERFITFDQDLYKTYRDLPALQVELLA